MHVVATAGHVDHGKSTLVRALTGMEPDRFAEERRRGMTIDLGYAWTALPSGDELAFVDVPGHERFIANMLAGLGPAPGVLFVVAADGGWSRQSEEHLAAIHALDLRHGLLAVTRSDLAAPEPALAEARERIGRSSLGRVEAVVCSGATGAGLTDLRSALDRLVAAIPPPDPAARIRLWIDRAFTIRGSGTVVTGTLSAGTVAAGDVLALHGQPVTVRGVQSLGADRERVSAPARIALNLRAVDRDEVRRGDVLTTPGSWHWTRATDVRLDTEAELPADLVLHLGTAAEPVRVRPLGARLARLSSARELPVQAGDRGVLRDPSRHSVVAGIVVLDADPPRLARRGAAGDWGRQLAARSATPDAALEIRRRGAVPREHLQRLGIDAGGLPDRNGWLIDDATWQRWIGSVAALVTEWAVRHPLDPAMPAAALSHRLGLPDERLVAGVAADSGSSLADGRIVDASRKSGSLGPAERGVREVEQRLRSDPFGAPESGDLARLRLGARELAAAERAGRLTRITSQVVLLPSAPALALERLCSLAQPFTTSAAREALGTTRRVAVPLLEHLDALGWTERLDGTERRVVGRPKLS